MHTRHVGDYWKDVCDISDAVVEKSPKHNPYYYLMIIGAVITTLALTLVW